VANFELSKWYLDFVSDSGDVCIVYTGTVNWGILRLGYSSLLQNTGSKVTEQRSLRDQKAPELKNNSLSWSMKRFGIDAVWQSDSFPQRATIFASKDGAVEWNCLMPRARVKIGDRYVLGYAEHLVMTIAPWKIPIRQLRWGRFLSASDFVVWIDWEGDFSCQLVYMNGKAAAIKSLSDRDIALATGERLTMNEPLVLRSGALGTTALSAIPGIEKTFPVRLLRIDESKWRSRAQLKHPNGQTADGWAIHERVTWPK
jgi:hypothetical protein